MSKVLRMTSIILAGGRASRMEARDKSFLEIDNEPIIKRQLRKLKSLSQEVIIVSNSPDNYKGLKEVKVISDVVPNCGPLGGIYSGLLASRDDYNFVVACDMPFIDSALIQYMHKNAYGYDIVVPRIYNRYEPLFCIYSKKCLKYIKELLDKKVFKISTFFSEVVAREITENEVVQFTSPEKVFINVNTQEDLKRINGYYVYTQSRQD
jgi:molybdopterin-guanine dinucleotide biosynthesis protein A